MKKISLAVGLLLASAVYGQNFAGVGVNYDATGGGPKVSGDVFFAKVVASTDAGLRTISYTDTVFSPEKTGSKAYVLNAYIQTGFVQEVLHKGPFSVGLLGQGGVDAGGSNIGYAASAGVTAFYETKTKGYFGVVSKWTHTSISGNQFGKVGLKYAFTF